MNSPTARLKELAERMPHVAAVYSDLLAKGVPVATIEAGLRVAIEKAAKQIANAPDWDSTPASFPDEGFR